MATEDPRYLIRLGGRLDARHLERLGGLHMSLHTGGGRSTITELSGTLADQAALMGVLEYLYDLGVQLLSVERQAVPGPEAGTGERAVSTGG